MNATQHNMAGSDKQIKWAEDIIGRMLAACKERLGLACERALAAAPERAAEVEAHRAKSLAQLDAYVARHTDARYWIDNDLLTADDYFKNAIQGK